MGPTVHTLSETQPGWDWAGVCLSLALHGRMDTESVPDTSSQTLACDPGCERVGSGCSAPDRMLGDI